MSECVHQHQQGGTLTVATLKPPYQTCLFCELDRVRFQLASTTRELEAAKAQIVELTRQVELQKPLYSRRLLEERLKTAVGALEWYAETPPSSSLYTWDCARKALDAIRGMEKT